MRLPFLLCPADDWSELEAQGDGADSFVFESASAFSNIDVITDFSTGQSDNLNLADVVDFDPGIHAITDFVEMTTSGTDTTLKVDANGTTGGVSFVADALDKALNYLRLEFANSI